MTTLCFDEKWLTELVVVEACRQDGYDNLVKVLSKSHKLEVVEACRQDGYDNFQRNSKSS